MNYTERMIELNPVLGSILGRCETHIQDMIGSEVRVILEEPVNNDDSTMPLWGWMNTVHRQRYLYSPKTSDLDRLLNLLCEIWGEKPTKVKNRETKEVMCMKQIFAMLAREQYPRLTLIELSTFLGRGNHSTAVSWIRNGRKYLVIRDPYFMSFYSPVKYLFDGDNI